MGQSDIMIHFDKEYERASMNWKYVREWDSIREYWSWRDGNILWETVSRWKELKKVWEGESMLEIGNKRGCKRAQEYEKI